MGQCTRRRSRSKSAAVRRKTRNNDIEETHSRWATRSVKEVRETALNSAGAGMPARQNPQSEGIGGGVGTADSAVIDHTPVRKRATCSTWDFIKTTTWS